MKKKAYMKPAMRVVALKQRSHLLTGSTVQSVSNSDGLRWRSNRFENGEDDY